MLDAWVNSRDLDIAARRVKGVGGGVSLADRITQAAEHGTEVLLISAETLDRLRPVDADRFNKVLAGHQTTFLLTVTRPILRWASGWQELLKNGLADYPRDAARHLFRFTCLEPGRVEELVNLLDVERRVVRVVRTSPHEESLPRDVAESLGIEWPEGATMPESRNTSMRTDAEIMRRLNAADLIPGARPGGYKRLRQAKSVTGTREVPGLAQRYLPPDELALAAEQEQRFLSEAAGVEVLDPHGQLTTWQDLTPPEWYQQISRFEAIVPELEELPDPADLLWRARQERAGLRDQLDRTRERLRELEAQVRKQRR